MGIFFTSMQIYNSKHMSMEEFLDLFCKKMKKDGYEICDDDSTELSYVFSFGEKWIAVSSDKYEEDDVFSSQDTSRIAKMLKTICINTTIIDSECAAIDLYGTEGKKADTLIMGQADDYFGYDIPQPSEKIWAPFLSDGSTWEQFNEILNGDYVFIEEGLSKLSAIIGISEGNIVFSFDGSEEDENTVRLSFRQQSSPKEKKLTLKAAFIKVFGEALEPLGYKKAKGANPYFVHVVNDEIIHVITMVKTNYAAPGHNSFDIFGEVLSVYNRFFDLSSKPEDKCLQLSLSRVYSYQKHTKEYDIDYQHQIFSFKCEDSITTMITEMKRALEASQRVLFPFIHSINNIESLFKYLLIYEPILLINKAELIYLKVDNYNELIIEKRRIQNEMYRKCLELQRDGYTKEEYERRLSKAEEVDQRWFSDIPKIRETPELYETYKNEEKTAKEKNINILKKYEII